MVDSFVIDIDCLNFLLDTGIGRKILKSIRIYITENMIQELNASEQRELMKFNPNIERLTFEDKQFASELIIKLNGEKVYGKWYLDGTHLRKIQHIGEAEGASIAHRLKIDIVILDGIATSILKQTFKRSNIAVVSLWDFGTLVLTLEDQIKNFRNELERHHLRSS